MHFQYFSVMGVKLLIREYENPNRDDNHPLRSHLNLLETHFAVIIGVYHFIRDKICIKKIKCMFYHELA